MDLTLLWIALSCFSGSVLAALANWVQSGSPFNRGKFAYALITGFITGLVFAGAYKLSNPPNLNLYDIFSAIVSGFGTGIGAIQVKTNREVKKLQKQLEAK